MPSSSSHLGCSLVFPPNCVHLLLGVRLYKYTERLPRGEEDAQQHRKNSRKDLSAKTGLDFLEAGKTSFSLFACEWKAGQLSSFFSVVWDLREYKLTCGSSSQVSPLLYSSSLLLVSLFFLHKRRPSLFRVLDSTLFPPKHPPKDPHSNIVIVLRKRLPQKDIFLTVGRCLLQVKRVWLREKVHDRRRSNSRLWEPNYRIVIHENSSILESSLCEETQIAVHLTEKTRLDSFSREDRHTNATKQCTFEQIWRELSVQLQRLSVLKSHSLDGLEWVTV